MPTTAILERSSRRCGNIDTITPNIIPMEPMLAKPQSAYVAITSARFVYNRDVYETRFKEETMRM